VTVISDTKGNPRNLRRSSTMKVKMILLTLASAAITASVAIAAPPAGKGKPPTTGPGCKPSVSVVLTGTVAVAPGASPVLPFSLMVTAKHANHKAYVTATQPVAVTVTTTTKISRKGGDKSLADLLAGDRVTIHARACKADLKGGATPALTATKVDAHSAHA
jgi:hypothetical protein